MEELEFVRVESLPWAWEESWALEFELPSVDTPVCQALEGCVQRVRARIWVNVMGRIPQGRVELGHTNDVVGVGEGTKPEFQAVVRDPEVYRSWRVIGNSSGNQAVPEIWSCVTSSLIARIMIRFLVGDRSQAPPSLKGRGQVLWASSWGLGSIRNLRLHVLTLFSSSLGKPFLADFSLCSWTWPWEYNWISALPILHWPSEQSPS